MSEVSNINTFWDLINEHRIEIPLIQRDYAQGRNDTKAVQIRESFVRALVDCLTNDTRLHLEFIYGKVEGKLDKIRKNKQVVNDLLQSVAKYSDNLDIEISYNIIVKGNTLNGGPESWFIPLDGQQRLTTLFLFHWYISSRLDIHIPEILSRFSYKIRRSSKAFCKALVSNNFRIKPEFDLSKIIQDSPWFYRNWYKDPTVSGMLTVLDEIQSNLKTANLEVLSLFWHKLTTGHNITFKFLDLDRFRLTDELYVKMNARGRHLTDFENFKAWLQEYVRTENFIVHEEHWHKKLDLNWTDIFWKFRESGTYEIDTQYLSFFKQLGIYSLTENFKSTGKKNEDLKLMTDEIKAPGYVSESVYQRIRLFNTDSLELIMKTLNAVEHGGYELLEKLLAPLSDPGTQKITSIMFGKNIINLELSDSVYVYAIVSFLKKKNINLSQYTEDDKSQLLSWARVIKNLTNNTFIYADDFLNAIQSVKRLTDHAFGIYSFLSSEKPEIAFFNTLQRDEEITKAKLVLKNKEMEGVFIETERHTYFSGQIGFLISMASDETGFNLDEFRQYSKKAGALFSPSILNSQDFIFQRAYLTFKNYFLQFGANRSFCKNTSNLRDKEDYWRKVLKDEGRREKFKELLNAIDANTVRESLQKLIEKYKTKSWKTYFVKSPEPFRICKEQLVRMDEEKEHVLLFKTTRVYGGHAELRTYFFYSKHIKGKATELSPFKEEFYWYNQGNSDSPCIVLDEFVFRKHSYQLLIYYRHTQKAYELQFRRSADQNFSPTLAQTLVQIGFQQVKPDYLSLFIKNEMQLLPKISELRALI